MAGRALRARRGGQGTAAHVLEAVRRAVAKPADSLSKLANASDHCLRPRQSESFGALWKVVQLALQMGIKKALGVTPEAELSYWLERDLHLL